mmetsp:Transcript_16005/g.34629  ORF Transcript_16005/g.34629 Transcript_16005/m.34629 type:complete len:90 (+) Transcript_16005:702-971(+)
MTTFETTPLIAKNALLPMPDQNEIQENSLEPAHAMITPPTTGIRDRYTRISIFWPRTNREARAENRGSIAFMTCAKLIELADRLMIVQS